MTLDDYATEGNVAALRDELARGATVDERSDGWTPLMKAAKSSCAGVDVLRALVEHGADVDAERKSKHGEERPLRLAIRAGNLEKAKYLVSAGASVAYRTSTGYDALLDAVYSSEGADVALIRYLLDEGARVDGVSKHNETAIKVAARMFRMDVVRLLLDRGATDEELHWGPLGRAVALGTLADVEAALEQGADVAQRDCWGRTPWMLSLELGDIEKIHRLFRAGVDREDRGHFGRSALSVAAAGGNADLIHWLIDEGFGLEDADTLGLSPLMHAVSEGHVDAVKALLVRGARIHARHDDTTVMSCANDRTILQLLLDAGGDLAETSEEMRRTLRGKGTPPSPAMASDDFQSGRGRRFGRANPESMNVPFWRFMVQSGKGAYWASARFGAKDAPSPRNEPVWCFSRYGQSITILPNGNVVEIGGEHEDFYDADFCIYNDVVVHDVGGSFAIYGYAKERFPPTDFHTATFFQGSIYVIGSLGYRGERGYGTTPVYRLDCTTFAMESVATRGSSPGWIHKHRASLDGSNLRIRGGTILTLQAGKEVCTENEAVFTLDLGTMSWSR